MAHNTRNIDVCEVLDVMAYVSKNTKVSDATQMGDVFEGNFVINEKMQTVVLEGSIFQKKTSSGVPEEINLVGATVEPAGTTGVVISYGPNKLDISFNSAPERDTWQQRFLVASEVERQCYTPKHSHPADPAERMQWIQSCCGEVFVGAVKSPQIQGYGLKLGECSEWDTSGPLTWRQQFYMLDYPFLYYANDDQPSTRCSGCVFLRGARIKDGSAGSSIPYRCKESLQIRQAVPYSHKTRSAHLFTVGWNEKAECNRWKAIMQQVSQQSNRPCKWSVDHCPFRSVTYHQTCYEHATIKFDPHSSHSTPSWVVKVVTTTNIPPNASPLLVLSYGKHQKFFTKPQLDSRTIWHEEFAITQEGTSTVMSVELVYSNGTDAGIPPGQSPPGSPLALSGTTELPSLTDICDINRQKFVTVTTSNDETQVHLSILTIGQQFHFDPSDEHSVYSCDVESSHSFPSSVSEFAVPPPPVIVNSCNPMLYYDNLSHNGGALPKHPLPVDEAEGDKDCVQSYSTEPTPQQPILPTSSGGRHPPTTSVPAHSFEPVHPPYSPPNASCIVPIVSDTITRTQSDDPDGSSGATPSRPPPSSPSPQRGKSGGDLSPVQSFSGTGTGFPQQYQHSPSSSPLSLSNTQNNMPVNPLEIRLRQIQVTLVELEAETIHKQEVLDHKVAVVLNQLRDIDHMEKSIDDIRERIADSEIAVREEQQRNEFRLHELTTEKVDLSAQLANISQIEVAKVELEAQVIGMEAIIESDKTVENELLSEISALTKKVEKVSSEERMMYQQQLSAAQIALKLEQQSHSGAANDLDTKKKQLQSLVKKTEECSLLRQRLSALESAQNAEQSLHNQKVRDLEAEVFEWTTQLAELTQLQHQKFDLEVQLNDLKVRKQNETRVVGQIQMDKATVQQELSTAAQNPSLVNLELVEHLSMQISNALSKNRDELPQSVVTVMCSEETYSADACFEEKTILKQQLEEIERVITAEHKKTLDMMEKLQREKSKLEVLVSQTNVNSKAHEVLSKRLFDTDIQITVERETAVERLQQLEYQRKEPLHCLSELEALEKDSQQAEDEMDTALTQHRVSEVEILKQELRAMELSLMAERSAEGQLQHAIESLQRKLAGSLDSESDTQFEQQAYSQAADQDALRQLQREKEQLASALESAENTLTAEEALMMKLDNEKQSLETQLMAVMHTFMDEQERNVGAMQKIQNIHTQCIEALLKDSDPEKAKEIHKRLNEADAVLQEEQQRSQKRIGEISETLTRTPSPVPMAPFSNPPMGGSILCTAFVDVPDKLQQPPIFLPQQTPFSPILQDEEQHPPSPPPPCPSIPAPTDNSNTSQLAKYLQPDPCHSPDAAANVSPSAGLARREVDYDRIFQHDRIPTVRPLPPALTPTMQPCGLVDDLSEEKKPRAKVLPNVSGGSPSESVRISEACSESVCGIGDCYTVLIKHDQSCNLSPIHHETASLDTTLSSVQSFGPRQKLDQEAKLRQEGYSEYRLPPTTNNQHEPQTVEPQHEEPIPKQEQKQEEENSPEITVESATTVQPNNTNYTAHPTTLYQSLYYNSKRGSNAGSPVAAPISPNANVDHRRSPLGIVGEPNLSPTIEKLKPHIAEASPTKGQSPKSPQSTGLQLDVMVLKIIASSTTAYRNVKVRVVWGSHVVLTSSKPSMDSNDWLCGDQFRMIHRPDQTSEATPSRLEVDIVSDDDTTATTQECEVIERCGAVDLSNLMHNVPVTMVMQSENSAWIWIRLWTTQPRAGEDGAHLDTSPQQALVMRSPTKGKDKDRPAMSPVHTIEPVSPSQLNLLGLQEVQRWLHDIEEAIKLENKSQLERVPSPGPLITPRPSEISDHTAISNNTTTADGSTSTAQPVASCSTTSINNVNAHIIDMEPTGNTSPSSATAKLVSLHARKAILEQQLHQLEDNRGRIEAERVLEMTQLVQICVTVMKVSGFIPKQPVRLRVKWGVETAPQMTAPKWTNFNATHAEEWIWGDEIRLRNERPRTWEVTSIAKLLELDFVDDSGQNMVDWCGYVDLTMLVTYVPVTIVLQTPGGACVWLRLLATTMNSQQGAPGNIIKLNLTLPDLPKITHSDSVGYVNCPPIVRSDICTTISDTSSRCGTPSLPHNSHNKVPQSNHTSYTPPQQQSDTQNATLTVPVATSIAQAQELLASYRTLKAELYEAPLVMSPLRRSPQTSPLSSIHQQSSPTIATTTINPFDVKRLKEAVPMRESPPLSTRFVDANCAVLLHLTIMNITNYKNLPEVAICWKVQWGDTNKFSKPRKANSEYGHQTEWTWNEQLILRYPAGDSDPKCIPNYKVPQHLHLNIFDIERVNQLTEKPLVLDMSTVELNKAVDIISGFNEDTFVRIRALGIRAPTNANGTSSSTTGNRSGVSTPVNTKQLIPKLPLHALPQQQQQKGTTTDTNTNDHKKDKDTNNTASQSKRLSSRVAGTTGNTSAGGSGSAKHKATKRTNSLYAATGKGGRASQPQPTRTSMAAVVPHSTIVKASPRPTHSKRCSLASTLPTSSARQQQQQAGGGGAYARSKSVELHKVSERAPSQQATNQTTCVQHVAFSDIVWQHHQQQQMEGTRCTNMRRHTHTAGSTGTAQRERPTTFTSPHKPVQPSPSVDTTATNTTPTPTRPQSPVIQRLYSQPVHQLSNRPISQHRRATTGSIAYSGIQTNMAKTNKPTVPTKPLDFTSTWHPTTTHNNNDHNSGALSQTRRTLYLSAPSRPGDHKDQDDQTRGVGYHSPTNIRCSPPPHSSPPFNIVKTPLPIPFSPIVSGSQPPTTGQRQVPGNNNTTKRKPVSRSNSAGGGAGGGYSGTRSKSASLAMNGTPPPPTAASTTTTSVKRPNQQPSQSTGHPKREIINRARTAKALGTPRTSNSKPSTPRDAIRPSSVPHSHSPSGPHHHRHSTTTSSINNNPRCSPAKKFLSGRHSSTSSSYLHHHVHTSSMNSSGAGSSGSTTDTNNTITSTTTSTNSIELVRPSAADVVVMAPSAPPSVLEVVELHPPSKSASPINCVGYSAAAAAHNHTRSLSPTVSFK